MNKRTIRIILCIVLTAITILSLSGCKKVYETNKPVNPITAKIVAMKGPTGIGMVRVMNEIVSLSDYVNTEFEIMTSTDTVVAGLIDKSISIAAVPTNLAAVLYNKTEGEIQILAVHTLGVLHILDKTNSIKDISDLKGKTLIASGQNSLPQYVLNFILTENGIDPEKDIEIIYKAEHSEVATLLLSGQADIVMLPEPFVSTVMNKDNSIIHAIDLNNEWVKKAPDITLSMGCLVAQKSFIEENPEEVKTFLDLYKESIEWVLEEPYNAAPYIVSSGIIDNEIVAENAIPNCNIVYIDAVDAKESLDAFFEFLYNNNPSSVGGKLPDSSIYYMR
ncbi:MAG: ABC transporter substrate-binding protein [Clostridia bacterium]|jgi:NitT/TauT family transport system substrate-binding protein